MATHGASLRGYQSGRCEIPQAEAFVITVKTTGRQPADIECSGAQSPNVGTMMKNTSDPLHHVVNSFFDVRKPCGNDGPAQICLVSHSDRRSVQLRALPQFGAEKLVGEGVVDDAKGYLSVLAVSNGDGRLNVAVGVVHGAVDRVNNPNRHLRLPDPLQLRRRLFRQEPVFREALLNPGSD